MDADSKCNDEKPPLHVAMLPWLAMGHIFPYFELAKILAQKGHFVTFINTPKNIDRIPKPPKILEPFINFARLPLPQVDHDHLPEGAECTMDIPSSYMYCYLEKAYHGLQHPISKLLESSKPDWVVYDFEAGWLPPIAKSLNIPCAHFSIMPAWNIACFLDPPKKMDDYQNNSPSNLGMRLQEICEPPKWVPFRTNIHLRPYEVARVFAYFTNEETGESPAFDLGEAYSGGDMLIVRTSRELEGEWLDYLADRYKVPVVPVGLLPPSMQIKDDDDDDDEEEEEEEENDPGWVKIKAWLDTQEVNSSVVVYIGFGSELKLNQEDLTELAYGLELSRLSFFWALKNPKGRLLELPEGFEDRTADRGIVWKTWAPQLKILAHGAIGGCITHCGFGSVIEKLHFGHVLVTLPYLPDHALFSRVLEEKKVAIEVPRNEQDGSFTRNSVAKTLRLAIVDEEGKTYRENAKEMGKVFSSEELHNRYIEEFIAALQKYRLPSNKS